MSQLDMTTGHVAANASESARATFIKKTYLHVAGALAVFAVLMAALVNTPMADIMMRVMGSSPWAGIGILIAFMGVSWVAHSWANSSVSREKQYLGLGLYIAAFSVLALATIAYAARFAPDVLQQAAIITAALTAGITYFAFATKKDFSFLAPFITVGFFIALGVMIAGALFGFTLGWIMSAALIVLLAGAMLYNTSNIIHHYHTEQYVAAALGLFADIGFMFLNVVQLLLALMNDD
jgi:FtsH-binding integral membrane protein